MFIDNAISTALSGVQRNLDRFERTVERIARDAPLGDLPRDLVELTVQRGAQASLAAIRTADEMVGTLLNVLA